MRFADMPGAIEVVISGIAGRFPECDSTEEFKQKLYDNVDLLTTDNRRWVPGNSVLLVGLTSVNKRACK